MNEIASLASRLCGIIPPLVTPLTGHDEIDRQGTIRLLEHVIDGGVNAVFILGTTGEAPSLSYRLRREFIALVCETVKQRVPVLVGITDTSFVESVSLAQHAAEHNADALVLSTPYYFPAGQTELKQYVTRLLPELPLPLMLYNMPSLTKVWFEPETLSQLAGLDNIVGVKDSSGDLDYFAKVVSIRKELRPDWRLFVGPEHLLVEAAALGANGGVNGGANIFPSLFSDLYAAASAQDADRIQLLQARVEQLQAIYDVGKYASRHIKATKCALSLKGICSDHLAEPFNHFLAPERQKVDAILRTISI